MRTKKRHSDFGVAMLFISPFTLGFLLFILYPTIMSLYYSFTEYNALKPPVFVGIKNYAALLQDAQLWNAVGNTLYMLLLGVPLVCLTGLAIAVVLNRKVPLLGLFRTVIYLPAVVPPVAVALIWTWLLNPNYGLVNAVLEKMGLARPGWLADPRWAKPALLLMAVFWGGAM